jgi:hypothetical protein
MAWEARGTEAMRWASAIAVVLVWLTGCTTALADTVAGTPSDGTTHWAFQPPIRPPLPHANDSGRVQNHQSDPSDQSDRSDRSDPSDPSDQSLSRAQDTRWVQNPIDRFILAKLQERQLAPSLPADRVTLIRRLSLDLIGLPPSIEEVDAFIADNEQGAYQRLVDRLLSSPHYGERWGRHWLDAARYADSDGFEKDKPRYVWFYRDWVIDALNRDLPYDQFIIQQIAGDLLPEATQDEIVATGFLRNSMINEEGGIDPEQFRMEAMFDRMDAIGKSILGITIQCGQCHDHKYDPLTQEEYYRIFAFLNNDHEANVAVYTPQQQMQRAELFRAIQAIEAELQHQNPDWPERMAQWEKQVNATQPQWTVVRPDVDEISNGGQKYIPMPDGSLLAQGYAPTKHRVKLSVKTELAGITAFRLELLMDPNLPLGGPGRSIKGTGALTELEVEAAPADAPDKVTKVTLCEATADIQLPETPLDPIFDDQSGKRRVTGPAQLAIDGKDETAWGIDAGPGRRNQPRKAVFRTQQPISHPNGTLLTLYLTQNHGGWNSDDNQNHNLGRFRISITTDRDAVADPLPAHVRQILAIPADERGPAQVAALFRYWRTTVPEWQEANARIEVLWKNHPEAASQLVLEARAEPRGAHVLARGDFLRPGAPVSPGVPAFLHALPPDAEPSRLTLARWLVDRSSPTTARAIVNRIWQNYFGMGIVSTSEDLGTQSEAPAHPELLDWLAVELMDRGWSLKALHRLIVTSATYRQSSNVTPELVALDPYNRLLARGPRLRVEAEIVRDIALAASGLLNPAIGGRSVYPPLPEFMLQPPVSYGPKTWHEDHGAERYRRALYTFRYRSLPYPVLQTFDAPNGDFSCVRRTNSNTPLQALTTLNEPIFVECAQALALRTLRDGGSTDGERIEYAFRRCVARRPTQAERDALTGLLAKQQERLASGELNAAEVAAIDAEHPLPLPDTATPAQLAAWTVLSRVLLNLDETITKE